jgi:serine/threonine-protein kinase HipA
MQNTGSYEALLNATYLYTGSSIEVEKMYKYIVFNCLIGNGDAHLKILHFNIPQI